MCYQMVEVGIQLHVEIENLTARSGNCVAKDHHARKFFSVGSSNLDFAHVTPLSQALSGIPGEV